MKVFIVPSDEDPRDRGRAEKNAKRVLDKLTNFAQVKGIIISVGMVRIKCCGVYTTGSHGAFSTDDPHDYRDPIVVTCRACNITYMVSNMTAELIEVLVNEE